MKYKALPLIAMLAISIGVGACTAPREEQLLTEATQASELAGMTEAELSASWLNLDSVQNARQLGGYPTQSNRVVRQDTILRTGELALLTNADKELLVNKYKLAHIIDLRDEIEA